jgi:Bacterial dnaA protein helix-turn-helix
VQYQIQKTEIGERPSFKDLQLAFSGRFGRPNSLTDERIIAICDGITDILAVCFSVPSRDLRSRDRIHASICRVRQIGMYVTHVSLCLNMTEVAKGFGRDRSTVVHSCHLIEDMRDEIEFDRIVGVVERIAQAAFGKNAGE